MQQLVWNSLWKDKTINAQIKRFDRDDVKFI